MQDLFYPQRAISTINLKSLRLINICSCQNYGPLLDTLNIRGRIIIGTRKGTIILTTSHIYVQILTFWNSSTKSMFSLSHFDARVHFSSTRPIFFSTGPRLLFRRQHSFIVDKVNFSSAKFIFVSWDSGSRVRAFWFRLDSPNHPTCYGLHLQSPKA